MFQETITNEAQIKFSLHALDRMAEPTKERVDLRVRKYVERALKLGHSITSQAFRDYLVDKINLRKISEAEVIEVINSGRDTSGQRERDQSVSKFEQNQITVIFDRKDHSVITAYRKNNSEMAEQVSDWVNETLNHLISGAKRITDGSDNDIKTPQLPLVNKPMDPARSAIYRNIIKYAGRALRKGFMAGSERFIDYIKGKLIKGKDKNIPTKLVATAVECAQYKKIKKTGSDYTCEVAIHQKIEKLLAEYELTKEAPDLKVVGKACEVVHKEFLLIQQMRKDEKLQRKIFSSTVDAGEEHQSCLRYEM